MLVASTARAASRCLALCMSPPFVGLDVGPHRRALGELLRAVRLLVRRETDPWRSPEAALREEILARARATELGPRLADARASLPSVGRRRACDEDQPEVIVCQIVCVRHEEVRRDAPMSAAELPLAALDLPDGGAVPEVRVGRAAEPSRADAAEGEDVAWGELDRPRLVEGAVIREDNARDEDSFLALARIDTPSEPVGVDGRDHYLARRACTLLEHS